MTLRDHCTARQRRAHVILDAARAGMDVDADAIRWALRELGELVNAA